MLRGLLYAWQLLNVVVVQCKGNVGCGSTNAGSCVVKLRGVVEEDVVLVGRRRGKAAL